MAAMHTHASKAIVNRFTGDVTQISLRNVIYVSLYELLVAACLQVRRLPVVLSRHKKANERRSNVVDHSWPPTGENKNGMNGAGRSMNAAGQ
jgi:hypothetical protein